MKKSGWIPGTVNPPKKVTIKAQIIGVTRLGTLERVILILNPVALSSSTKDFTMRSIREDRVNPNAMVFMILEGIAHHR